MKELKISYSELRRMPIRYRYWFIERCNKLNSPEKNSNVGGIEIDDDTPLSSVLGKMYK